MRALTSGFSRLPGQTVHLGGAGNPFVCAPTMATLEKVNRGHCDALSNTTWRCRRRTGLMFVIARTTVNHQVDPIRKPALKSNTEVHSKELRCHLKAGVEVQSSGTSR